MVRMPLSAGLGTIDDLCDEYEVAERLRTRSHGLFRKLRAKKLSLKGYAYEVFAYACFYAAAKEQKKVDITLYKLNKKLRENGRPKLKNPVGRAYLLIKPVIAPKLTSHTPEHYVRSLVRQLNLDSDRIDRAIEIAPQITNPQEKIQALSAIYEANREYEIENHTKTQINAPALSKISNVSPDTIRRYARQFRHSNSTK